MPVVHARYARRLAAMSAASVVALCGCYAYVAPPRGTSLVGKSSELWLSDSGAVVLASQIGPSVEAITGSVIADSANGYVVALSSVRRRDGDETIWNGESVFVSSSLITEVGARRFSPSRTALFSGIVSAGLVAARMAFQGHGTGGGGGGVSGSVPK